MSYSESLSESGFNSPSDSESDFSSVNLDICIFLRYVFILLNKLGDDSFYLFSKQNQ